MTLLSNMSIQRTQSSMSPGSGAGGYRYLGTDCITVDNDAYRIGLNYDDLTLAITDGGSLTVNNSFIHAGDNVTIGRDDSGIITISAAMFQSQFQEGDRVRYEAALTNLGNAQIDIISLKSRATALETLTGSGENGHSTLISGLDTRLTTAEGTITSHGTRIGNLESAKLANDVNIENLQTLTGSGENGHSTQISQLNTALTALGQTVASHTQSLSELSGTNSGLGSLGERIDAANLRIDGCVSVSEGLDTRITAVENAITGEDGINDRLDGHDSDLQDHAQSISSMDSILTNLAPRVVALENVNSAALEYGQQIQDLSDQVSNAVTTMDAAVLNMETVQSDLSDLETLVTETYDGRITTLETFITDNTSDIESISTISSDLLQLSSDHNTLDEAVTLLGTSTSTAISGLDGRLTSVEDDVDNLKDRMTAVEGSASNSAGKITTLEGKVEVLEEDVPALQSDVSDLQDTKLGLVSDIVDIYNAPALTYTRLVNASDYDFDKVYYLKDSVSYVAYYPETIQVEEGDSYDSSISYYAWSDEIPLPVDPDDPNAEQEYTSGYVAFTYTDAEGWESAIQNGLYYAAGGADIFTYDVNSGYTADNSSYLDLTQTYYTYSQDSYSHAFVPDIIKVDTSASYDSNLTYYTRTLTGTYEEYVYDVNTFTSDLAAGLYVISNISAAITEGIYNIGTSESNADTLNVTAENGGVFTASSGTGNSISVDVNGEIVAEATASEGANVSVSVLVPAEASITVAVTAVNKGTGIRGLASIRYFA